VSEQELPATLSVEVGADDTIVVRGDIDIAGGPTLDAVLIQRQSLEPLVLDLTDVSFVDSSGLRCLISASRRSAERSQVVTLRGVGAGVLRLLEITGTTGLFDIEPIT
jgi:anti-sigma B factor antagonist